MVIASSISGLPIYAPSAGFAPTNSADVSAIASAYQVVSATGTQLNAGTAYLTSVNGDPISASRAGQAANASLATSAYYDGTGRLISALPDSDTVSAIASAYAESAVSGKQDTLSFSYDDDKISAINGSALAGQGGGGMITSIQSARDPWWQTSISGLNGSSLYPRWAESAESARNAISAGYATEAGYAGAAPTAWASSFITGVASPSGTIRVLGGTAIESTNSAVMPSTVIEGFSTSFGGATIGPGVKANYVFPTANPSTEIIVSLSFNTGLVLWSSDNGIKGSQAKDTAPETITVQFPNATAVDIWSDSWIPVNSVTASAATQEIGGGVAELAWASALPTYSYDAEDKISAINGSAIAGGGGGVDSATVSSIASSYAESAVSSVSGNYYTTANESGYALSSDVSATVDLVGTQSANWGGSALALSAGPGVKLKKVGNTLVASTDRTTLWSGELTAIGSVTASESLANFEKIELHWHTASGSYPIIDSVHINDSTPSVCFVHGAGASNTWIQWCMCSASSNTFAIVHGKSFNFGAYKSTATTYSVSTSLGDSFQLNKIVGINRTAGV